MSAFITETLPIILDNVNTKIRHMVRRRYLRKRLKPFGNHKKAITKQQRKEAKAFWKQYTPHFSPLWHELFAAKTGAFDVRYVPVDIMFTEIEGRLNRWSAAHGIDNKNNYSMYFPEVRHPYSVFRKMNGLYHDDDYRIISKEQAIENCKKAGDVIFKVALESGKGGGISFWRTENGEARLRQLIERLPDEVNAQEFITQHPDIAAINKSSVNTIRVMSYASEEGIRIISAYLQLGTTDARQDQISAGGVDVCIRPDGTLEKYAIDGDYNRHTKHPCGLVYDGFRVPGYDKLISAVKVLHNKMGNFRLVSWDFAIAEDEEPIFIEMNLKYGGIMYHQMSGGPLFGEDTEKILNDIFGK